MKPKMSPAPPRLVTASCTDLNPNTGRILARVIIPIAACPRRRVQTGWQLDPCIGIIEKPVFCKADGSKWPIQDHRYFALPTRIAISCFLRNPTSLPAVEKIGDKLGRNKGSFERDNAMAAQKVLGVWPCALLLHYTIVEEGCVIQRQKTNLSTVYLLHHWLYYECLSHQVNQASSFSSDKFCVGVGGVGECPLLKV